MTWENALTNLVLWIKERQESGGVLSQLHKKWTQVRVPSVVWFVEVI